MATVVSARGDPGQDRWQLFAKYYETIYDRELQKALPAFQAVLAGHKDVIDRLHHEIGFWLQFQGEAAGTNSLSLRVDQLRQLVLDFLGPSAKGFDGRELDELADNITEAARRRLVFLTSRVEGELAFEVRGLQEYMAAECLMTGPSDCVFKRLTAIAPSPYWRNVFLFAAGKCFFDAQSRHYQDPLRLLCEDLNASADKVLKLVRAGSDLGLAILQSGAPAQNPLYTRHLSKLALELLSQPDILGREEGGVGVEEQLAAVYRESASSVYRDTLQTRVGQADLARALGAWPLLARLADRGHAWAIDLVDQHWPSDVQDQQRIFAADPNWWNSTCLRNRAFLLIPQMSPFAVGNLFRNDLGQGPEWRKGTKATYPLPDWYQPAIAMTRHGIWAASVKLFPGLLKDDPLGIEFAALFRENESFDLTFSALGMMPSGHQGWIPYTEAHRLFAQPGAPALAGILRSCLDRGYDPAKTALTRGIGCDLPWPLAACLAIAGDQAQLSDLAMRVERGQLGDATHWRAAENRWAERGILVSDLNATPAAGNPFDASIASAGFPFQVSSLSVAGDHEWTANELGSFIKLIEMVGSHEWRETTFWLLCYAALRCPRGTETDFARLTAILQGMGEKTRVSLLMGNVPPPENLSEQHFEFYNLCGLATGLLIRRHEREPSEAWVLQWEQAFIREPRRLGLLRILSRCAWYVRTGTRIPPDLLSPQKYSDRRIALAALLLRLSNTNLNAAEAQDLASWAARLLDPPAEPNAAYLLFEMLETCIDRVPALEFFLIAFRENLPPTVELGVARCDGLLRRVVRKRPSRLQQEGQLAALGLPNLTSVPA
jgi:hypothetical protein